MAKKKDTKPPAEEKKPEAVVETVEVMTSAPELPKTETLTAPKKEKPKKPKEKPLTAEQLKAEAAEEERKLLAGELGLTALQKRRSQDNPSRAQPPPKDIQITARQYVRLRKVRWDKTAGFLAHMKRTVGPTARLTRNEWLKLWDAFWSRPVK